MKHWSLTAVFIRPLCMLVPMTVAAWPAWSADSEPEQHEYIIRHFKTESGVDLPEVHVVYGVRPAQSGW